MQRSLVAVAAAGGVVLVSDWLNGGAYAQTPTQTPAQSPAGDAGAGRTIEVVARRFRYEPDVITIKPGESVTLAFTALDFVHGFSVPDLGLRADLIPGRVTPVKLPALKRGRYSFLCDNFCGDHHEDMSGTLIVGSPDG